MSEEEKDWIIHHDDGMRFEQLQKYAVRTTATRQQLEEYGDRAVDATWAFLRERLFRDIEKAGRLVVNDLHQHQHEHPEFDEVVFTMTARTRESDQGEWPAIRSAYWEDQAALRSGEQSDVE